LGEAGTYFYHSHIGFQAVSCAGALIVESREDAPYEFDEEKIIMISDYYNKTDEAIEEGLVANPFRFSGEPNAILLNGQSGTASKGVDASCEPAMLEVEPGKTYRLRFIGGTAISQVMLGIEEHKKLTIIEADGTYTKPHDVGRIQIASGQRFSVLFKAKTVDELRLLSNRTKSYFWIQYETRDRPVNVTGLALLSYKLPAQSPVPSLPTNKKVMDLPSITYDWLEYALEPLDDNESDPFPEATEVTRRITISVEQLTRGASIWMQNQLSWVENKTFVPYLVDIYRRGQAAIPNSISQNASSEGWDPTSLAFPARLGEVIELVWQNTGGEAGSWDVHPFHAHGRHFWDIGSGNGTYNATANEERLRGYRPVKRDTTMLYRYATKGVPFTAAGWRAWRFRVENPGVWMLHCHILQHMIMGMYQLDSMLYLLVLYHLSSVLMNIKNANSDDCEIYRYANGMGVWRRF
jgi:L-ascorbate oxidase